MSIENERKIMKVTKKTYEIAMKIKGLMGFETDLETMEFMAKTAISELTGGKFKE